MADVLHQHVHQRSLRVGTAVGQGAFEMIPDALVRVQFGGVRRERDQVEPGGAGEEVLHRIPAVDGAIVQQHDHLAADVVQQLAEEPRDVFALDVVLVQLAVQRTMEALGADGDAGDGGNPVVALPIPQDGGLAHRTPGFANGGDQEEARFIDEDDMGCQPRGVFFTRGQTVCFQSAMAASSRSTARPSGFWWLHPNWCRSLPT